MNNQDTATLSAEEYADQVIEAFDPEWHGTADHIDYVTDEVVAHIARTAGIEERNVNRDSVRTMVESRVAAARR